MTSRFTRTRGMDEIFGKTLSSGHIMPTVGVAESSLGHWVDEALDVGFRNLLVKTHTTTAPSTERDIANWLQSPHASRDQLFITTQLSVGAKSNINIKSQCLRSLYNIGCDYLDLVVLNKTPTQTLSQHDEFKQQLLQTWQTLESLVQEGQVRTLGLGNFDPTEIEVLFSHKATPPGVVLADWSYIRQERGTLFKLRNYCKYRQIQLVISLHSKDVSTSGDRWCSCVRSLAEKYKRPTIQVAAKAIQSMNLALVTEPSNVDDIRAGFKVFDWALHPTDLKLLQGSIYD